MKRVFDCKLSKECQRDCLEVMNKVARDAEFTEWLGFTKRQRYILDVRRLISEVNNISKTIYACKGFLSSYSRKVSLPRIDQMTYHLESYMGNIVGFFDRCLMLTNGVFALGIKPKEVTFDNIISASRIKQHKLCKELKDFNDLLNESNLRTMRNQVAHREALDDQHTREVILNEFNFLDTDEFGNDKKFSLRDFIRDKKKLKESYRNHLRNWEETVERTNDEVFKMAEKVLSGLFEQYAKTKNSL